MSAPVQVKSWSDLLSLKQVDVNAVDYAISHIDEAPKFPAITVYSQFNVKPKPPATIAVSGAGGVIGALLALKHTDNVKYFLTTEEVLKANDKSPLYLAKYAIEKLKSIYPSAEVVTLKLGEFDKIKAILSSGGVYVSGLPYEVVIQISQLAGFGKLWHFAPLQKVFYVF
mgnify:CR=1 FL=1